MAESTSGGGQSSGTTAASITGVSGGAAGGGESGSGSGFVGTSGVTGLSGDSSGVNTPSGAPNVSSGGNVPAAAEAGDGTSSSNTETVEIPAGQPGAVFSSPEAEQAVEAAKTVTVPTEPVYNGESGVQEAPAFVNTAKESQDFDAKGTATNPKVVAQGKQSREVMLGRAKAPGFASRTERLNTQAVKTPEKKK